jgi:hypothetical protein
VAGFCECGDEPSISGAAELDISLHLRVRKSLNSEIILCILCVIGLLD